MENVAIKYAEIFARLADWIPEEHVKFREGANGGHYIKAPTAMNRLDSVLGPAGWWDDYRIIDELTVECSLSIRLPDGSVLTKKDVGIRKPAKDARIDPGCSWKAAYSDAFKRTAAKFGIARHLCKCGFPEFVGRVLDGNAGNAPAPVAEQPPPATERTLPAQQSRPSRREASPGRPDRDDDALPIGGSQFYRWAKSQDEQHQVGLLKYITSWAALQEFPRMMKEWDVDQASSALAEAHRKLASILQPAGRGEAY